MRTLITIALLAAIACDGEAAPFRADDGVALKPRASRPTCPTGKRCIWAKTDSTMQSTDGSIDTPIGEGKKRVLSRIVHGSLSNSTLLTPTVYAVPFRMPNDVVCVRVQIAMRDSLGLAGNVANASGMKYALGTPNIGLTDFASAPTEVTGITYPAVGEFYISSDCLPVTPNAAGWGLLSYTMPAGTFYGVGSNWHGRIVTNSTTVTSLSGSAATDALGGTIGVIFDTGFAAATVLSDSLWLGVAASGEVVGFDVTPDLRSSGIFLALNGVAGTALTTWANFGNLYLRDNWTSGEISGHTVFVCLGFNDLQGARTGSQIKTDMLTMMQQLQARAKRVIPCTIPTSSVFNGTMQGYRAEFNTWVRGLTDYLDVDTVVGSDGRVADAVHWTEPKFRLLETALIAKGIQ